MLQSDAYVEGRGFHMEYRQLKCKNATKRPTPEALTLRKSLHEQTLKTAVFIGGNANGASKRTNSDQDMAVAAVSAISTATERPEKVGHLRKRRC